MPPNIKMMFATKKKLNFMDHNIWHTWYILEASQAKTWTVLTLSQGTNTKQLLCVEKKNSYPSTENAYVFK